jgi:hypothetical protein
MSERNEVYYISSITPVHFCGNQLLYQLNMDGDFHGVFRLPFEVEPTAGVHDFNKCENCQKTLAQITQILINKFNGTSKCHAFPLCCPSHSNLLNVKEFDRAAFNEVPAMVARKIIYTGQHIENNYNNGNWYKLITDYIDWVIESFGTMPKGCGEGLFLSDYILYVTNRLKNIKDIPAVKKNLILEYFNAYKVPPKEHATDLNILVNTYEKWFNIFPFELNSYFGELKQCYDNEIPIFQTVPEENIYSGISTAKPHTKITLIQALLKLTNNLLYDINAATLLQKGLITNANKVKFELLISSRKLELAELYKNQSPDEEKRYRRILKKWLRDEEKFIDKITPLLEKTSDKLSNTKNEEKLSLPTYALLHVFLAMHGGQAVTQQNKNELARGYGYKSGDQLRNEFSSFQDEDKRLEINTANKRSASTHLKRYSDILPLLETQNEAAFKTATKEYEFLKKEYNKYY